jgi:hypothetical protein
MGSSLEGPPFTTKKDWEAWVDYCGYDTVVLAKNIDSSPVLSRQKNFIYTVSHFSVLESLKSDVPLPATQTLVTYRLGGEVKDAGETLRFETSTPAYKQGKEYLLLLNRAVGASLAQYAAQDVITVAVRNSRIYPSSSDWAGFLPGTEYSEVVATLKRVSRTKACGSR